MVNQQNNWTRQQNYCICKKINAKLESNNKTTTCTEKDKKSLSAYDIKGEEKTSRTSEKEKGGYVCIYECGEKL